MADSICAISTYPQNAAIGIVRASGPGVLEMAGQLFVSRDPSYPPFPRGRLVVGSITLLTRGRQIPECLLACFPGPRSYTGEDVCEFQVPGNVLLLGEIMEELVRLGCRPAEKGEFTRRAWENGRMDLPAAEMLNELIRARTREGMLLAASQMDGALSRRIAAMRQELVDLITCLEAVIEFGETEGVALDRAAMIERSGRLAAELNELARSFSAVRSLREGCRVVIAGKANVGKSSLFNYLAGTPRAIVHDVPGTTRDVLRETVEIGGVTMTLHDTAGFRAGVVDGVEGEGQRRSQTAMAGCDGMIVVVDGSAPLEEPDRSVVAAARAKRSMVIVNKIDLGRHPECRVDTLVPTIEVSALVGTNCEGIGPLIERVFRGESPAEGPMVMTLRQKRCLGRAGEAARRAVAGLEAGQAEEIVAEELRASAVGMSELIGEVSPQEVVDRIFAGFCVGK
ncbi:MAG: tRNA uridine-5-carboxymethylaminomethyl(34) synthesis GTPase MnmE [Acidobacteria bacterium]|nr:tRNA uridine-5-carboxymethylaminomethyl(34) synthesis GTPase MnmE [Acidobacteriota bacterium]